MERKIIKLITLLIMTLIIILTISEFYISSAEPVINVKETFSGSSGEGVGQMRKILGTILTVVRIAGAGIGIMMITVLGAKYMLASAGEKADIKKHATTYLIGAMVMIGASGILGIIQKFVLKSFGED